MKGFVLCFVLQVLAATNIDLMETGDNSDIVQKEQITIKQLNEELTHVEHHVKNIVEKIKGQFNALKSKGGKLTGITGEANANDGDVGFDLFERDERKLVD